MADTKRKPAFAGLCVLVWIVAWTVGCLLAENALAGDVEVYLTAEEAPHVLFPEATEFEKRRIPAGTVLRERIAKMVAPARPSLWEPSYTTYVASIAGKVIGYAVVVNEIGKHRPITFVVGVTSEGSVRGVEIMIYREAVGGDVRMKRFLKQYRGKDLEEPLQTGKDITNISGATLSVRAVNRGTRKALALVELIYRTPAIAAVNGPVALP